MGKEINLWYFTVHNYSDVFQTLLYPLWLYVLDQGPQYSKTFRQTFTSQVYFKQNLVYFTFRLFIYQVKRVFLFVYLHWYSCSYNYCIHFSGEMSHHEVLDAAAKGTTVLLSDHSNSERGFLTVFRERLAVRLPDSVAVVVSTADRDPLEVVWPSLSWHHGSSARCLILQFEWVLDIMWHLMCL